MFTDDVNHMTSYDSRADVINDVCHLQEIIEKFKLAQLDPTEFACLKGIVIFKTGSSNFVVQLSPEQLASLMCFKNLAAHALLTTFFTDS